MDNFTIDCMGCIIKLSEVEIMLENGHCVYSCKDCIPLVITENADSDNPVHSITEMEVE